MSTTKRRQAIIDDYKMTNNMVTTGKKFNISRQRVEQILKDSKIKTVSLTDKKKQSTQYAFNLIKETFPLGIMGLSMKEIAKELMTTEKLKQLKSSKRNLANTYVLVQKTIKEYYPDYLNKKNLDKEQRLKVIRKEYLKGTKAVDIAEMLNIDRSFLRKYLKLEGLYVNEWERN